MEILGFIGSVTRKRESNQSSCASSVETGIILAHDRKVFFADSTLSNTLCLFLIFHRLWLPLRKYHYFLGFIPVVISDIDAV